VSLMAAVKVPSDLPIDQCDLIKVLSLMDLQSVDRSAAIAKHSMLTLKQFEAINSKIKDDKKPIIEQLSLEDIDKFSKQSQQLQTMKLSEYIESRYERDINVLGELSKIADDLYHNRIPEESDPNYIYFEVLMYLRNETPFVILLSPHNECNIQLALQNIEEKHIDMLHRMDTQSALIKLQRIADKYQMKKIDISKLSEEDKREYIYLRDRKINPMIQENNYIQDLENIKNLARTSKFMYKTYNEEMLLSGGNVDSVSTIIENKLKDGEINKIDKQYISAWYFINEKTPSLDEKLMNEETKQIPESLKKQLNIR
jgi:hypothetical protein